MRKRLIDGDQQAATPATGEWLNLDDLAEVAISSEDAAHLIEAQPDGLPAGCCGTPTAATARQ